MPTVGVGREEGPERKEVEGELKEGDDDLPVLTWGEESYDGLGDALQEGGDELNDETFGGVGKVGEAITASLPGPSQP